LLKHIDHRESHTTAIVLPLDVNTLTGLIHIVGKINHRVAWAKCDSDSEGRDCWGSVLQPSAWPPAPHTS